jgi:hypothetical protein
LYYFDSTDMPGATRTFPADIITPVTQASLFTGLRDALSGVFGVPPLKSYVATDQFAVWQLIGDAAATYGKAFYRLRVTSTLLTTHNIGATWTDATNTLGNPSGELQSVTYTANNPVIMRGFGTNEYKFSLCNQGTLAQTLGYFRPVSRNFNEAFYPRFFIGSSSDLATVSCTGLSPYSVTSFSTQLGQTQFGGLDPVSQTRSSAEGFWLYVPTNNGVLGQTSEDLAMGACAGMARGDTFTHETDPDKKYFVTRGAAGALLIRL